MLLQPSGDDVRNMEVDLAICPECSRVFDALNATASALGERTLPRSVMGDLCSDCFDLVQELLEGQGF